jgi:hypothetical protein
MRKIETHKAGGGVEKLDIEVLDAPGQGGANHLYGIYGFHSASNPSAPLENRDETCLKILFQNGPIAEAGTNGVTHEALLAVVIDRLKGFQAGPFACRENAIALTKLEEALLWLQKRTRDRLARGVEGTNKA